MPGLAPPTMFGGVGEGVAMLPVAAHATSVSRASSAPRRDAPFGGHRSSSTRRRVAASTSARIRDASPLSARSPFGVSLWYRRRAGRRLPDGRPVADQAPCTSFCSDP
jgi:hypothetical protein